MPVYKKVNKNFFKTWTPNMAYILGFFAADGYITVNRRGGQFWCIQITDKNLLQNIKKAIDAEHKISIKTSKKPNEKTLYRLQIGSIEMCNDLRNLGFKERKTKSLTLPQIPPKYMADFVRGYFDGDGNVWFKNKVAVTAFTSCSYDFLNSLKKHLELHANTVGGSLFKTVTNSYRLQYSSVNTLILFNFMYNSVIRENSLFLTRKKVVFEKYKSMRS